MPVALPGPNGGRLEPWGLRAGVSFQLATLPGTTLGFAVQASVHPSPYLIVLALALCGALSALPSARPVQAQPRPNVEATGEGAAGRARRPFGAAEAAGALSILVYDGGSLHGLAVSAAQNLSPSGTTLAAWSSFNTLLQTGAWDAVAIDCPSRPPMGGWAPLIQHVNGGGAAVLSFWNWESGGGGSLAAAFDVKATAPLSFTGGILFEGSESPASLGVTLPSESWHQHWPDDGDQLIPLEGAQALAHVGRPHLPVLVRGNGGKTIAAPVLDEAGDEWLADGSAVQLWENLILMVGSDGPQILVYDNDTDHSLARIAAFELSPGDMQVADAASFNGLLASRAWEAVLVDAPNNQPAGGWTALIGYVNGGGHVAMSFWDWDGSAVGFGDPALGGAFDIIGGSSFSWTGAGTLTLHDTGLSDVFAGVSMPNASWHDHFSEDGELLTPRADAKVLAHAGSASEAVMVWGNSGRTVAAPVFDEAGDEWLGNGGGIELWKNLFSLVSQPHASCTLQSGILGLNPSDYACVTPPVVGELWVASVSTTPTVGASTLTTLVVVGLGGPAQAFPLLGFELLILPPFFQTAGQGTHAFPVPPNPLLVGVALPSQGARLELDGAGSLHAVLTNGQDLVLGF